MITGFRKNSGFSLIEIAVVVTIFGLVAGTISVEYNHYMNIKATSDTLARRDLISEALSRYVFTFGGLPCPASPSLPPSSPMAGVGDCTVGNAVAHPYTVWPYCDPATSICVVQGILATGYNPDYQPPVSPYNDPVLIGTIPYVDLGISLNDSIDGWHNRLTYAVSYYLTYPYNSQGPPFDKGLGAIGQENYNTTSDNILPTNNYDTSTGNPTLGYMLAVVSHGPDGKGAWNYDGQKTVPCQVGVAIDTGSGGTPSPTSTGRDNQNCQGTSTFLANGTGVNNVTSFTSGQYFYDDAFVLTDISLATDKWQITSGINQINNKSGGKVGIGTASPVSPLDVQGNILAQDYQSKKYCDKTTGKCFSQSLLSPGLDCNGGLMTGVANSAPVCQTLIDATAVTPGSCPSGQFVIGVDSTGRVQCAFP